jgi:hypothetical protein
MNAWDEQRMEAVVGMDGGPRERFRKRDEADRFYGCGIYEGREVVLDGTSMTHEEIVKAIVRSTSPELGWTVCTGAGAG